MSSNWILVSLDFGLTPRAELLNRFESPRRRIAQLIVGAAIKEEVDLVPLTWFQGVFHRRVLIRGRLVLLG